MANVPGQKAVPAASIEATESVRTGLGAEAIARSIMDHLHFLQARHPALATPNDWYMAVAYAVRDRMLDRWISTIEHFADRGDFKAVGYLSAEFLPGPHLGNGLVNLGIWDATRKAVESLGQDLSRILAQEEEPGLGNGGLGRLAACFMDSLATLDVPAIGYGIRYEFGIFDQEVRDGWQVEITDKWLRHGNPWEIPRPERTFDVQLGGRTEPYRDADGKYRVRWIPDRVVRGVAHDTPIPGYKTDTVNLLRLWKAEATESFDFAEFNAGDYFGAVDQKVDSETISKVLYPNDEPWVGKQLRLAQQYFFVSCSLQDVLQIQLARKKSLEDLPRCWALQMNDTHPAIAVAELMRLLIDEHSLDWDRAWSITRDTLAYTNHTLLPEALERWPLPLFAGQLPRHLEIIYEINRRFLEDARARFPGDDGRIARLSLIDESGPRYVRMANLASAGSHAINGVAALHSDLLKRTVLSDFHALSPETFHNVTNGVTPRRWVALANRGLAALITGAIGEGWLRRPEAELPRLEPLARDPAFQEEWRRVKRENKAALSDHIRRRVGIEVDPSSLFDIQVKRIHEYKRQHLNVLHVIALYERLRRDPKLDAPPRTVIFGGKAAPGYFLAKLIIKLINSVAEVVNGDPAVAGRLRVAFVPDFNVTVGHLIYPAADLSEQISTAGKEASGTGNMKFSLNGALTIGTLDGANVEIREAVGEDSFFLFGLTVDQVQETWARGYRPRSVYESRPELREAIDRIASGFFSKGDANLFRPLVDSLLEHDPYLVLADHASYVECQDRVGREYRSPAEWTRKSILNVARMGRFSSDRSIREYCERIWGVRPTAV